MQCAEAQTIDLRRLHAPRSPSSLLSRPAATRVESQALAHADLVCRREQSMAENILQENNTHVARE